LGGGVVGGVWDGWGGWWGGGGGLGGVGLFLGGVVGAGGGGWAVVERRWRERRFTRSKGGPGGHKDEGRPGSSKGG